MLQWGREYHLAHEASLTRRGFTALFLSASLFLGACASSPSSDSDEALAAYERGDYPTVLRYFLPLAEEGDAVAQFVLGGLYQLGAGVPQDFVEAAKWYLRSAEQGDADAQYTLGVLRDPGALRGAGDEVTQDYAEAARWYRRAADQGNPSAQYALGVLYTHGNGVARDQTKAHVWYDLAARRFSENEAARRSRAEDQRDKLAQSMTAAQLAEARRLAREWRPKREAEGK